MKLLKVFYQYIWRYKWLFILGSVLLIVAQIGYNVANYYVKFLFDALSNGVSDPYTVINIIAGFIFVNLLSMVIGICAWTVTDKYMFESGRDLKLEIVAHLHDLDFSYHASKKSGSLISAIRRGDSAFFSYNNELNREIMVIVVDFVFIVVAFFGLNWELSMIVLFSVVIMLSLTGLLLRRNIKARRAFNKVEDDISGIVADNLINFETVKFFAKEKFEQRRLRSSYRTWLARIWGYSYSFREIEVVTSLVEVTSLAAIFGISLWMTSTGALSTGNFVLVITFALKFYPQMFNLVFRLREIAKDHTDLEKYFQILDEEPEVKDRVNAGVMEHITGEIAFNNVAFGYRQDSLVINGLELKIKPNESVAFVGLSGAGKTTLVKLLLRFYDVSSGSITIDGTDIRDVTKTSLRANIGIVPQEPILFNDTIGYNIGYPQPKADLEEIRHSAQMANLDGFIESLPEKYETQVGERGIKLSGGQKQRLAIARVFLANPEVLIFDEATSQLDSESESLIQDALWKVAKNKTTIIIAHRLSTVMRADRIIVLDQGKIREEGTHSELVDKTDSLYKKLWDLQRGGLLIE
jgi:ATP-binding cassette, subfamily B, heavy metal transporter